MLTVAMVMYFLGVVQSLLFMAEINAANTGEVHLERNDFLLSLIWPVLILISVGIIVIGFVGSWFLK